MKGYPSPKLAARMHFYTLKTALKIEQKCKKHEELPIFKKTAGNIAKSSKFQPKALL